MVAPLAGRFARDARVLVGADAADDAGVYLLDGNGLVATVDFITPVCDDPERFGRIAAANSLSDVWAMGGEPLFVLNLCCFPTAVPAAAAAGILAGAADAVAEAGAVVLGGHTVADNDLKFGLSVVGRVDPDRILHHATARPGDALVLTKPVGTGVLVNAYKRDALDASGLEPALVEMERLNAFAARAAVEHGAHAATDVTGFGFAGHLLDMARASAVAAEVRFDALPTYDDFYPLVREGVSTRATPANRASVGGGIEYRRELSKEQRELLFDPQTSGGLLVALPAARAAAYARALDGEGHRAAVVGEVTDGPARVVVV